jgi:hypothetical protein
VITAEQARRYETWLVVLVALHSYLVGGLLVFASEWTLAFAGWKAGESLFFIRQGGVFHLVVATGYLLEYFRHGGIWLMLVAKTTAVVFLLSLASTVDAWSVPFSGITDGLMLVTVLAVRVMSTRGRASAR